MTKLDLKRSFFVQIIPYLKPPLPRGVNVGFFVRCTTPTFGNTDLRGKGGMHYGVGHLKSRPTWHFRPFWAETA